MMLKRMSLFVLIFIVMITMYGVSEGRIIENNFHYTNGALGKTVTASKQFTTDCVVDGDPGTSWVFLHNNKPEWLYVDMEEITAVDNITIQWGPEYHAQRYDIYTSNDAVNWNLLYAQTKGTGGTESYDLTADARYYGVLLKQNSTTAYVVHEFELNQKRFTALTKEYTFDNGTAYKVSVKGDYAFCAETNGLQILDISNPAAVKIVNEFPGYTSRTFELLGDYLYYADSTGLKIADVSDVYNVRIVGEFNAHMEFSTLYVTDRYVYLGTRHNSGVIVLDTSICTAPVFLAHIDVVGRIQAMYADADYLYVGTDKSYSEGELYIIDLTTYQPAGILKVLGGVIGMTVVDGYAYLATGFADTFGHTSVGRFFCVNVGDAANPVVTSTVELSSRPTGFAYVAGYAFVTCARRVQSYKTSYLHIIDVANPDTATMINYEILEYARGLDVDNGRIIIADDNAGIKIFTE